MSARDDLFRVAMPTLVEMSKTEHDLDLQIDELDDDVFDHDVEATDDLVDEFEAVDDDVERDDHAGLFRESDEELPDDAVLEVVADELVADELVDGEPVAADELPEIVSATEEHDDEELAVIDGRSGADPLIARQTETPDVSNDVLDELRRADIDGPTVQMVPQDDTSSAIRRPRRSPDYDPAPFPIPMNLPRVLGRKPRVRRVTRVVRHVDPWSVFKIAFVANIVLYLIVLTAGVLLWNVAYATGTVDNVERFFESFGWSSFEFNGGQIYHNAWIGGLFVVIGLTGLAVLLATLFNLITDLVGGMRFTVLEEEVVEARTSPMRRFVVRRAEPEVPFLSYDESGAIVRETIVGDSGSLPR